MVELEVLGARRFPTRAKIAQDGTILLPYLGQRGGRRPDAPSNWPTRSRALLRTAASSPGPILRVDVVSFSSRYVTVLGAVGSPGLVPINKAYRLSEILARVGGISPAGADYIVVRPENGPEKRYSIRALVTGDISQDPYVAPGDKIFLPQAEIFYISGQIKAPGPISAVGRHDLADGDRTCRRLHPAWVRRDASRSIARAKRSAASSLTTRSRRATSSTSASAFSSGRPSRGSR